MGLASMATSAVLQLLLLLLGSVNAASPPIPAHMHHPFHHAHPPMHAPGHVPSHYHSHHPSYPPTYHTPSPPPSSHYSNRKFVAVQGVVYCKSCKYSSSGTLTGAIPILGAIVKLQCYNTKHSTSTEAKTDKNGYFFLTAPKTVTTYGVHKCKVFLVSSPLPSCNKETDLHGGVTGATLMDEKTKTQLSFGLYTVGPFAFEPSKC